MLALIVAGVGVAALGTGVAFGLVAKSKYDRAERTCPDSACNDRSAVGDAHAAATSGNLATVGFVLGAVCIGAGAVLWLTGGSNPETKPHTEVSLGLGTLRVTGVWQ